MTEITGIRKAAIIILLVVVSWMAAIGTLATAIWIYDRVTEPDRVVSGAVRDRMRHHGIEACFEDHNGGFYFYRHGKKVRL